jgi:hypothetical protein
MTPKISKPGTVIIYFSQDADFDYQGHRARGWKGNVCTRYYHPDYVGKWKISSGVYSSSSEYVDEIHVVNISTIQSKSKLLDETMAIQGALLFPEVDSILHLQSLIPYTPSETAL